MQNVTIVIPNLNGMKFLEKCLSSLREQTYQDFQTVLVDNGSTDGSVEYVRNAFPEVSIVQFPENRGFCAAVNQGIKMARTPYVLLLNNDTEAYPDFVAELVKGISADKKCFSCASRMVTMADPRLTDNAGDFYCALGWAYARGKNRPAAKYGKKTKIFSACAGAALYRTSVFEEIGLFDEAHFAYLEDVDVAYRAKIAGYHNLYIPDAVVRHVGSATSGSVYNEFKIRYSSRNSIYLIYKNMPAIQILLNFPLLAAGILIKMLFFAKKGYLKEYCKGIYRGIRMCHHDKKVVFCKKNLSHYVIIQLELWYNVIRRFCGA